MLPYTVLAFQLYKAYAHLVSNFIKEAGLLIISKEYIHLRGRLTIQLLSNVFISHTYSAFSIRTISFSERLYPCSRDRSLFFFQYNKENPERLSSYCISTCINIYLICAQQVASGKERLKSPSWSCGTLSGFCVQTPSARKQIVPRATDEGSLGYRGTKVVPQTHSPTLS